MTRSLLRRLVIVAASATLAMAGSSAAAMASSVDGSQHAPSAGSQQAPGDSPTAAVVPLAASGCSADACITLDTPFKSGGNWWVLVHGCTWQTAVYGYIHIFGPSGTTPQNSATKTWHATSHYCTGSDDAFVAGFENPPTGKYCSETISGGVNDGIACENLYPYK